MSEPNPALKSAAATILAAVHERLRTGKPPVLVALDGGSGAGKSTLARLLASELNAALILGDDFYAAEIPDAEWDHRTPAQRAARVIDWRRLRAHALEPLLAGKPARWLPFDFSAPRPDGTYPPHSNAVVRQPADVIILDGAYSSRAELADLIDLSVLVDVPLAIRHQRLAAREDPVFLAGWHRRWDAAESYYFMHLRPESAFDLVVTF